MASNPYLSQTYWLISGTSTIQVRTSSDLFIEALCQIISLFDDLVKLPNSANFGALERRCNERIFNDVGKDPANSSAKECYTDIIEYV